MSELEVQIFNVLNEYKKFFVEENMIWTFGRWVLWWLVRLLMAIVDTLQKIFLDLWKLPDFFNSEVFKEMREPFVFAMIGIAVVSLMIYSIRRMINFNLKTQSFIDSLLLGVGTFLLSSLLIGQLLSASTQISKELINLETGTNYVYKMIEETGTDTLKAIRNNFNENESGIHLSPNTLQFFDYGTVITENYIKELETTEPLVPIEGLGDEWFKVFNYKIGLDTVDNSPTLHELNGFVGSWLGIEKGYYRYNMPIGVIISYLIGYIAVIFLCLLKYIQLFFEIAITQTILPLFSFTDLDGAKDLKKLLNNLKNAMLTMVLCALSLKMFSVFQYWMAEQDLDILSVIVMQIGLAIAVIDGASIVQELTGYDAGVKSIANTLTAVSQVLQGIGKIGEGAGKIGLGIGKAGLSGASAGLKSATNASQNALQKMSGNYTVKSPSAHSPSSGNASGGTDSKEAYVSDKMKGFNSNQGTGEALDKRFNMPTPPDTRPNPLEAPSNTVTQTNNLISEKHSVNADDRFNQPNQSNQPNQPIPTNRNMESGAESRPNTLEHSRHEASPSQNNVKPDGRGIDGANRKEVAIDSPPPLPKQDQPLSPPEQI